MACFCTGQCLKTGRCGAAMIPGGPWVPPSTAPQIPVIIPTTPSPTRIKSIEYHPDGTIKRIEYFS